MKKSVRSNNQGNNQGNNQSIEELFYRGNYADVVARTIDSPRAKKVGSELPFIIGALCFVGRLTEAECLFEDLNGGKEIGKEIKARFFLALANTRKSDYKKARSLLAANLQLTRRKLSSTDRFFIFQGVAFYRYFSGNLKTAHHYADQALRASIKADFLYGKILATDLGGHIAVQMGRVAEGLAMLTQGEKLAKLSGDGSLCRSLEISTLIYRARFGLSPKTCLRDLENALGSTLPQDSYSKSSLLLELSRQLALRGNKAAALSCLDQASHLIYAHHNRRHEVTLNLRYAYLFYLSGDNAMSLNFVRSARRALDAKVDRVLAVEVTGLELKIVSKLGLEDQRLALATTLREQMSRLAFAVSRRILLRYESQAAPEPLETGNDPLGDLMDTMKMNPAQFTEDALKAGYLGILNETGVFSNQERGLYLNLEPGGLTAFDRGNVTHGLGLTPLLTRIINALGERPLSKKDLIESIWGFAYDSLRHDSAIYTTMTSLRKLLGANATWLQTSEEGYAWTTAVKIVDRAAIAAKARLQKMSRDVSTATFSVTAPRLNYRQMKILSHLKTNETITTKSCQALFKTSEITASRDLSALSKIGIVVRVGQGRATVYLLNEKAGETNAN